MRASLRFFGIALPWLLSAATASAHFDLTAPKPADKSTNGGKGGPPCGPAADSGDVTSVTGGSELTISVTETVPHPGFYRVALALKSRAEVTKDDFPVENVVRDKDGKALTPITGPGTSASADFEANPKFPLLADNLFAHTGGGVQMFSQKVTLPNLNCEKCTLQVLEFMNQHGPDYFYRHCAELKITADPNKPLFDPNAPAGGAGGAGGGGTGGSGGAAAGSGGVAAGGTGGAPAGGTVSGGSPSGGTAGTSASAGTATTGGSMASGGAGGAGGTGVAAPAADDGGCSVGRPSRGAFSLLAGLGLGLALLRRRRTR